MSTHFEASAADDFSKNIVAKGINTHNEHFFLLSHYYQLLSIIKRSLIETFHNFA